MHLFFSMMFEVKSSYGDTAGRQIVEILRKEGKCKRKFPEHWKMGKTIVKILTLPYRREIQCSER